MHFILPFVLVLSLLVSGVNAQTNADPGKPARVPPRPGPELMNWTPEEIEAAYADKSMPEAIAMYLVIARGGQLDGNGGWFGPAQSRFSWKWLAEKHGVALDCKLTKENFQGIEVDFNRLDRDHDQSISEWDLDWSDENPWVAQAYQVGRVFRRMDADGDGRLTEQEWAKYFEKMAEGKSAIGIEQMRDALIPPSGGFAPGDAPSKEVLLKGLMAGEIGSLQEGPSVDSAAPDFELATVDGRSQVRLSKLIGDKPVVLVFGNFTCGPFRSLYPMVESVRDRNRDRATFLMVYVREAHPTDGWAMKSNERAGVAIAQPKTIEERRNVAQRCAERLKTSMPLLVDDVDDSVGNAYSGMPARLYVIDRHGKVAYKSGRGPFGFKPEEMEQALLMLDIQEKP